MGPRSLSAQDAPLLVTTEWLAANLESDGLVVLHVGNDESFAEGRIPGARHMLPADFAPMLDGMSTEMPDPAALRGTLEASGV